MRYLLKAIVFSAVCCVTWVATTHLRVVAFTPPNAPPRAAGAKVLADPAHPPAPIGTPFVGRSASSGDFKVEAVDGQAVVSFETKIRETDPRYLYLWVARIMSPDGSQEWNRFAYDTQIFTPKLGVELTPSFHEILNVPHGASRVMVSLYRFPKQAMDIVLHGSREEAWDHTVLQRSEIVQVP